MKLKFTAVTLATICFSFFLMPLAAHAASTASPNPAVPGDDVTITYTDKACGSDWVNLASLNEGVLVIDWPDGTQTLVDPVTDPVLITVPAGMTVGTADISLHKGFIGNGEYEACRGSFEIVEDATVPVVHTPTIVAAGSLGLVGIVIISKRRKLVK